MGKSSLIFASIVSLCLTALISAQTNLMPNGGFEQNGTGYSLSLQTGFVGTITYPTTGAPEGSIYAHVNLTQVTVTDPESDNWKAQLQLPQWTATKNANYKLTFKARSSATTMKVGLNRSGGTFVNGFDIPLTTAWQTCSCMFSSDTSGLGQVRINFYIGGYAGTYDFDSITLVQTGTAATDTNNLISNGGFELAGSGWNLYVQSGVGAAATISYPTTGAPEGTIYGSVDVTQAGTQDVQVQLQLPQFTAVVNAIYTVTFKARGPIPIQVVAGYDATKQYAMKESFYANITPQWATYSGTVTSDVAGSGALRINFYVGAMAGIYDFDSVSVVRTGTFVPEDNSPKTANIDITTKYQTIQGFGAAVAYYADWLTNHPYKSEIYKLLYTDAGLELLRMGNWYNQPNFTTTNEASIITQASALLGHPVKVLISSWSPPANLKSNGSVDGGTLIKTGTQYNYTGYAQYWFDALTAFKTAGINPTWVSIQNEPDYVDTWATCKWAPAETDSLAGYNKAFDAVYSKIQTMTNPPLFIGPENTGIASNGVQSYTSQMTSLDHLAAVAHHLYNGGSTTNPDSYNAQMAGLATSFPNKPRFETEFYGGSFAQAAWLLHNSLVTEGVSAYFHWGLIWPDTNALIQVEDYTNQGAWQYPHGYNANKYFYVLKHYSAYIRSGWQRVGDTINSTSVKVSAYTNPTNDSLTIVAVNTATVARTLMITMPKVSVVSNIAFQSDSITKWKALGAVSFTNGIALTPQSITTILVKKSPTAIRNMRISAAVQPEMVVNKARKGINVSLTNVSADDRFNLSLYSSDGRLVRKIPGAGNNAKDVFIPLSSHSGAFVLCYSNGNNKIVKKILWNN